MNDVLYVQGQGPAMSRNLFVAFAPSDNDCCAFNNRLELSLFRSRAARHSGTPNRTFFGGTTRKQVNGFADKAIKLGISGGEEPYHGGTSEKTRLDMGSPKSVRLVPRRLSRSSNGRFPTLHLISLPSLLPTFSYLCVQSLPVVPSRQLFIVVDGDEAGRPETRRRGQGTKEEEAAHAREEPAHVGALLAAPGAL